MQHAILAFVTLIVASSAAAAAVPPAPQNIEASAAAEEALHRSAPDPVRVTLAAGSAPALGESFTLTATLTASWRDLTAASVELTLPDGLAADGATTAVVDLPLDAPVVVEFSLTPVAQGTHELTVAARADVEDVGTLGGERSAFVVVPAEGAGAFHQDLVPRDAPRTISAPAVAEAPMGLLAATTERSGGTSPGAAVPPELPPAEPHVFVEDEGAPEGEPSINSHSTFQVRICWFYENEETPAADTPQRFATIQVYDEDDFFDDLLAEDVTGSDGCYTSGNIPREDSDGGAGNQDVFVRIHLCNTWVCVQDADEDWYVFRVDYGTVGGEDLVDLGGFKPVGGDNFGARAFQYANNAAYFGVNHMSAPGFSSAGPRVDMWAPSTDGSCDDGGMFIRRSENRIHVCSDSDRSPEDIGHEYGHFLQWKLYEPFWPSPGGPHNLCTDSQNRGLSWAEGFGNFYGPRVGNEVVAPSTDNNVAYDRPWDGSSFSIDMDTSTCTGTGDDNEMRVAHSLWDIRDAAVDGVDTGSTSNAFIASVVSACDSNNFREFFDAAGCSWIQQGGDACVFMRAAFQSNIDFDDNAPTVEVTSQGAFQWVRGTISLAANAADADTGCVPSVEFRISHDGSCSATDTLVGVDETSPYSRTFDTTTFTDDGSVWTCAQSSDGMKTSAWDASAASIGVDNTDPVPTVDLAGTSGNNGWWRSPVTVTLGCSDNLAGVADLTYSIDLGPSVAYTGPFVVDDEGHNLLIVSCVDNAGNSDTIVQTVKVDTIDPVTTTGLGGAAGENGWYVGDVTVTMSCSDATPGSQCISTDVDVTAPDSTVTAFTYAAPFVLTGDGVHNVAYASEDFAGNVETTQAFDVAIDTLPPTGEITSVTDGVFTHDGAYALGGFFTNEPSITVSYHAEDAASGLQWVRVVGGNVNAYAGDLDVTGSLVIDLPSGISTWTLEVEDMAGHVAEIGTFSVVYIPHGTFAGGVDPRTAGWWKNVVTTGAYSEADRDALLPFVNLASHAFGTPDMRYGEITSANYATYLGASPPSSDDRVRAELAAAWLNLVSGREPAAQTVDLASVSGWETLVTNTGGSSTTTAMNVIIQAEARLTESPTNTQLNMIKDLLSSLNSGGLNV